MALLAIVLMVTLPTLSAFFKGRTIDSEGRRLLALTHQAQSRAVSEGIPMQLWIDEDAKAYGLEAEPGWDEKDPRALRLAMDSNLSIEVRQTNVVTAAAQSLLSDRLLKTPAAGSTLSEAQQRNLPTFRFLPDGSFDVTNPAAAVLSDQTGAKLELRLARNRLTYEIAPAKE